jgi:hypothetical protein
MHAMNSNAFFTMHAMVPRLEGLSVTFTRLLQPRAKV